MPKTSPFNPYAVLGVAHNASDEEIRTAMARRLREDPDACVRIEHAYRILGNAQHRRKLDEMLLRRIWELAAEPAPPAEEKPRRQRRNAFGLHLPRR